MNDKELDRLFKDQLENLSVSPQEDLWQKIEQQLDERKVVRLHRLGWVKYAAVLVACLGVTAILYLLMPLQEDVRIVSRTPLKIEDKQAETVNSKRNERTAGTVAVEAQVDFPHAEDKHALAFVQANQSRLTAKRQVAMSPERSTHLVKLDMAMVTLTKSDNIDAAILPRQRVVEVDPIQPLVENPEEEETMLASSGNSDMGLIPNLLNRISDVLNPSENKTIQFNHDEEGSLHLDIVNSLVKNRNKKRR